MESEKQPKGLSPKTVRNVHICISTALDKAAAEKLIPYNPAKGCKLPKGEHVEMKTLPLDKIAAFFAEAKNSGGMRCICRKSPRDCGGASCSKRKKLTVVPPHWGWIL